MSSVWYICILILTNDFRYNLYAYLYVFVLIGLIAILIVFKLSFMYISQQLRYKF